MGQTSMNYRGGQAVSFSKSRDETFRAKKFEHIPVLYVYFVED